MNRLLRVAWVVSAFAITGPVSAATLFQATLSGDQEVPPVKYHGQWNSKPATQ